MRKLLLVIVSIAILQNIVAQKKPIDHSVYDGWQSIAEKKISNNGKYVAYTVTPQEGDGNLVVKATENSYKTVIPRGYNATITNDNHYVIFKIKPLFKDTREARIKKKAAADMPKDSLGILELGKQDVQKIARVKSFKTAEEGNNWVAYLLEKSTAEGSKAVADSITRINNLQHTADSLVHAADSLRQKINEAKVNGLSVLQLPKKETKTASKNNEDIEEGTELVLKNLTTGETLHYQLVSDYVFSKKGNVLVIETSKKKTDSLLNAVILWKNLANGSTDTAFRKFNDAKNYAIDEAGTQLAFVAERDSVAKALKKFYRLYYYKPGMDSAQLRGDITTNGVAKGLMISPDFQNYFSKDGTKLYTALAPIRPVKDTTLPDFETARLDVWNYKDDYLQPQQLVQLSNDMKKSYLAVLYSGDDKIIPLSDENCESIVTTGEGNSQYAIGSSTKDYRIQQQWTQMDIAKIYLINTKDGSRKLIADKVRGNARISPEGNYITWYDWKLKNWFVYSVASGATNNVTKNIKVPLFDEEDDHPDDPPPHGIMAWHEKDAFLYVYDKYDIWKCDPNGKAAAVCITNGLGRKNNYIIRYNATDKDERFIKEGQVLLLSVFDNKEKGYGWMTYNLGSSFAFNNKSPQVNECFVIAPIKAKNAEVLIYNKQTPTSNNLYASSFSEVQDMAKATQLSDINPQQKNYNWYTVELHHWKMLDGKMSEGLLYKPENFDASKKYPIIFYYYERDANNRYNYIEPAPVRASVNIAYYTSNGYLVFDPNIYYKTGQPGEDAYNSVLSAAAYLAKFKWVDTAKMGLQGHSWGGYQTAYLITRTNKFAAAEAGAPVSNMTSAYGGIRWGTGISRQFQYEHSQSRLGATLWERPDLYIKNSPLFRADKVKTPLLMMHNDKDDAVPWYQGIEYFSALKRLGKTVFLITYNDELHGLIERKDRKDWTIRMAQFFDHYLKGTPEPKWMKDGVPATLKGIDWGLEE